jgi:hypothetical protein
MPKQIRSAHVRALPSSIRWPLLLLLSGCSPGGPANAHEAALAVQPGALERQSTAPGGLQRYLADRHFGGQAAALEVTGLAVGRLVDVYATEAHSGRIYRVYADFLIPSELQDVPGKWRLELDPLLSAPRLVLGAEDTEQAGDAFDQLLAEVEGQLQWLPLGSVDAEDLTSTGRLHRDGALMLKFNDLLDPASVGLHQSVHLALLGQRQEALDARLLLDQNHGGVSASHGRFHSTRLIVDFTIDPHETAGLGVQGPLASLGLPAAEAGQLANIELFLASELDPASGQFERLTNLAGRALNADSAVASAGQNGVTGWRYAFLSGRAEDPNRGYLPQAVAPRLVARQAVEIAAAEPVVGDRTGLEWSVDLRFSAPVAGLEPAQGDVLVFAHSTAEVLRAGRKSGDQWLGTKVRFAAQPSDQQQAALSGPAELVLAYSAERANAAQAFVRIEPAPEPGQGILPESQFVLEFSQPLDPAQVEGLEALRLTAVTNAGERGSAVVSHVLSERGNRRMRLVPALPLNHVAGQSETYTLEMKAGSGQGALQSPAGVAVLAVPQALPMTIAAMAAGSQTGSLTLNFSSTSEDGIPGADWRGQFLQDTAAGLVKPRPVTRFSLVADRTQPVIGAMQAIGTGVQTPLSNLGSKLHLLWRYCDFGLPQAMVQDDTFSNIDVEGLSLSPLGGSVTSTFYPQFAMFGGHSDRLPDEALDLNLLPKYESSGFFSAASYAENYLDDPAGGPQRLHARQQGFLVSTGQVFTAQTGTPMVRFPWNQQVAPAERTYLTWRDTAIQTWGGQNGSGTGLAGPGVPVTQDVTLSGQGSPGDQYGINSQNQITPQGIPSVGLPLLMEFRCYPGASLSVNQFDVSIAVNSSPRPFFRAFSNGGFNAAGTPIVKDPDLEINPSGAFNGNPALGPIGAPTPPRDGSVYMGQIELITRISRMHSVLFDTTQADPDYSSLVVSPAPERQPAGTAILIAFRGDDSATLPANSPYLDATQLDIYGEPIQATNALIVDNPTWSENLDSNDGNRHIQLRITFLSNPLTNAQPTLNALGLTWRY